MSIFKYINVPVFLVTLAIGLFFVYLGTSDMRKIYVYPTPENVEILQYKDKANSCFRFDQTEVDCPTDASKISKIPVQS
jgi:hypothetical protein